MGMQSGNLTSATGYKVAVAAISAVESIHNGKALPNSGRGAASAVISYDSSMLARKAVSAASAAQSTMFNGGAFPGPRVSQEEVLLMESLVEELGLSPAKPARSGVKSGNIEH